MGLTVIIVNWNSKDYLKGCLDSLVEGNAGYFSQVVVVDSGSADGCKEMLESGYPWVELVELKENVGFATANNIGFRMAKGDKVLLLNPDTVMTSGSLGILAEAIEHLPRVGIVGPRILNSDGSLQSSCVQAFPNPLNQALDANLLRTLFPKLGLWGNHRAFSNSEATEVDSVSGACMLIKSDVYRELGGLRGDYFMYAEDIDICLRAKRAGLKVYHVPSATVIHYGGGSSSIRGRGFKSVMARASMERFMQLNYGKQEAMAYRVLQGWSALVRLSIILPLFITSRRNARSRIKAAWEKWLAILQWATGIKNVYLPGSVALNSPFACENQNMSQIHRIDSK
ncbi:MAG: glycosyltransferase family 2 protein [bacterium]